MKRKIIKVELTVEAIVLLLKKRKLAIRNMKGNQVTDIHLSIAQQEWGE